MIIVRLFGGLGNQMFQYALGRMLSLKHNVELKLDLTTLLDRTPNNYHVFRDYDLDIFKLEVDFATKNEVEIFHTKSKLKKHLIKLFNQRLDFIYIKEESFKFNPKIFQVLDNSYLEGFWQSYKYFEEAKNIIKNDFSFTNLVYEKSSDLAENILNSNSICVNVRRADFVTIPHANNFHGVLGKEYIEKSLSYIAQRVEEPNIFVFSDDMKWCIENLDFKFKTTFVGHEYAGVKYTEYLQLMMMCKHFIIPNSTFAWWAAWLNENPNKIVIAPQNWFKDTSIDTSDLIPSTWIRL